MEQWDVIVVGGGAAGLVATGAAARAGARVLLLEKMHRVARKVGISGKGRSNVTNDSPVEQFVEAFHHGGDFLRNAFARFFVADTIDLLTRRGVPCVTERGARVFPASGRAADVAQALYRYARGDGGAVRTEASVVDIEPHPAGFLVHTGGVTILARRVILATGGRSYPKTGSTGDGYAWAERLGHRLVPLRPALAPLAIPPQPSQPDVLLKNVRVALLDGERVVAEDFGEAHLRPATLGGAVPIEFARLVPDLAKPAIRIDFKPALDADKLDARLRRDLDAAGKNPLQAILTGLLPQAIVPLFVARLRLDPTRRAAEIGRRERLALGALCKDFRLPVTGTGGWDEALVTVGGVSLDEIDPRTMESKVRPGLHLCGELLDIDGPTGGYNLQAAFSTGYVAGAAAGTAP